MVSSKGRCPVPASAHPRPRRLQMLMKDSVSLGLVRAGFFVHGQTVNIVEQPSAELWPLLWPVGAALDALCTFGARAIGGIKRLLFAGFSHFSGEPKKSRNRLTKPPSLGDRAVSECEALPKVFGLAEEITFRTDDNLLIAHSPPVLVACSNSNIRVM
jgi:hypothetical protein